MPPKKQQNPAVAGNDRTVGGRVAKPKAKKAKKSEQRSSRWEAIEDSNDKRGPPHTESCSPGGTIRKHYGLRTVLANPLWRDNEIHIYRWEGKEGESDLLKCKKGTYQMVEKFQRIEGSQVYEMLKLTTEHLEKLKALDYATPCVCKLCAKEGNEVKNEV